MNHGTVAEPLPARDATWPVGERRRPGRVAYDNPGPIEGAGDCDSVVELDERGHSAGNAVILGFLFASGIYALIALPVCLLLV
jgi:hypothetical protein